MPLQRGSCDFCGRPTAEGRTYCGKECRVAYNNLLARQGKTVMQMLKVWRKHRGAKGTPGEGMIGEIATRVDAILEEDRERKRRMRQERPLPFAIAARSASSLAFVSLVASRCS